MESRTQISNHVLLRDPIVLGGFPGLGFIATIVTVYLINKLAAPKFAEIHSPYFQNAVISQSDGSMKSPITQLFFWKSPAGKHDLIILYGNTQPLTSYGQYELCSHILDFVQEYNCQSLISIGGIMRETVVSPHLFGTFTNPEIMSTLCKYGVDVLEGRIFGMTGLLLGLADLRKMTGFGLLVETLGTHPDIQASENVLDFLKAYLGLQLDVKDLENVVKEAFQVRDLSDWTRKRIEDIEDVRFNPFFE